MRPTCMICTVVPHATQSVQHAEQTACRRQARMRWFRARTSRPPSPSRAERTDLPARDHAMPPVAGGSERSRRPRIGKRRLVLASGTTVCSPDLHDREEQVDDERMPHRHVQAAEAHRRHLRRRRLHDDEQDVDQHQQGHHSLVEAASVSHGEGSEAAGAGRVPVQMWHGRAESRCRCGTGEPSHGADVAWGEPSLGEDMDRLSPVPAQRYNG